MLFVDGMEIRMRALASALVVLAANETGVDVEIGQRDAAQLFKVKVEDASIDRIQIEVSYYVLLWLFIFLGCPFPVFCTLDLLRVVIVGWD